MKQLAKRLTDLETKSLSRFKPIRRIIVRVGQTVAAAKAEYEAKHGPLGDEPSLIIRTIV
jgi:hypothetical protein